ncbi:hypothetical protein OPV22_004730 [Ensete ventricosum]|uniref:Uncharacterized protein n=1 Tax=Ensete ventricosum TaxID=4639 RepID=A0AAV8RJF9_ENSVE|nr:hypothetical protein OPV22_004730 [Ensete ventricosum]
MACYSRPPSVFNKIALTWEEYKETVGGRHLIARQRFPVTRSLLALASSGQLNLNEFKKHSSIYCFLHIGKQEQLFKAIVRNPSSSVVLETCGGS